MSSWFVSLKRAWPFVGPALPALVVVAVGTRVFWGFTQSPASIALPAWAKGPLSFEARASIAGDQALAKASVYATAMVFLFVCLLCILVCHQVIARQLPARRLRAELAIWGLILVIAAAVFGTPDGRVYHYFGAQLFERTVFPSAGWVGGLNAFDLMFEGVTAAAMVAGAYVLGAICVALGATVDAAAEEFGAKVRPDLKYLLFAASSVFVLGVVCANTFNGWAGAYYLPSESGAHKQFALALQAFVGVQATVYFLILAAMFAPVGYVALRRRSALLTGGRVGPAVWSDLAQHLAAIAAPLIAAPVLALIGASSAAH